MIYLDCAATTLRKPPSVFRAVSEAMRLCSSPGRGGYETAQRAERVVFETRSLAAKAFDCAPEQVCFTANATEGLNIALRSLLRPGDRVLISGLEHNAVTRTITGLGAEMIPVKAPLFAPQAWRKAFEAGLERSPRAVVCLHVSNVFGCVLPVEEIGRLCAVRGVPFVVDAAQSAGVLPVSLRRTRASFLAMPGHKSLFGPQGTGLLLCGAAPKPLRFGGTGSDSLSQTMPEYLPDCLEAGTLNVPGIAGLGAGLRYLERVGLPGKREGEMVRQTASRLQDLGARVFSGAGQTGVLSFLLPGAGTEEAAKQYAEQGIALRAGLHCAPLAHKTAGTLETGTIRLSVSALTEKQELDAFLRVTSRLLKK